MDPVKQRELREQTQWASYCRILKTFGVDPTTTDAAKLQAAAALVQATNTDELKGEIMMLNGKLDVLMRSGAFAK